MAEIRPQDFLLQERRSICVAANVPTLQELEALVQCTGDIPGVRSYLIGGAIGLRGLSRAVEIVREYAPDASIGYDHQRAGTHDERLAESFMGVVRDAGVDSVVLFPSDYLPAQQQWVEMARELGRHVIVGPELTNFRRLGSNALRPVVEHTVNSGGVRDIWVRGNDGGRVFNHQTALHAIGLSPGDYVLWLPRFVDEWGNLRPLQDNEAERRVYVIGRAIHDASDPRKAASALAESLVPDVA